MPYVIMEKVEKTCDSNSSVSIDSQIWKKSQHISLLERLQNEYLPQLQELYRIINKPITILGSHDKNVILELGDNEQKLIRFAACINNVIGKILSLKGRDLGVNEIKVCTALEEIVSKSILPYKNKLSFSRKDVRDSGGNGGIAIDSSNIIPPVVAIISSSNSVDEDDVDSSPYCKSDARVSDTAYATAIIDDISSEEGLRLIQQLDTNRSVDDSAKRRVCRRKQHSRTDYLDDFDDLDNICDVRLNFNEGEEASGAQSQCLEFNDNERYEQIFSPKSEVIETSKVYSVDNKHQQHSQFQPVGQPSYSTIIKTESVNKRSNDDMVDNIDDENVCINANDDEFSLKRRRRLSQIVPNPRKMRTTVFTCYLCNGTYEKEMSENPWWAVHLQQCHKCLKFQIPRIDISLPANAVELDANLAALYRDGVDDEDDDNDDDDANHADDDEDDDIGETEIISTAVPVDENPFGGHGMLAADQASKLLVLMCHARTCTGAHASQQHSNICTSTKYLMLHIRDCNGTDVHGRECRFPWCQPCKYMLRHLTHCYEPSSCKVCNPWTLPDSLKDLRNINEMRSMDALSASNDGST